MNIIHAFTQIIEGSKYALIFIGCFFEGPVVMISTGFLYRLNQFHFLPMYLALVGGDFFADMGWYCLGRFGARATIFKYGKIIGLTPMTLEKVERLFKKYHKKILIISKLTMGLGFAAVILVVTGISKVPFKNYLILNLVGGFIWTAFLIAIGYFFGNVYALISGPVKIIFLVVVLLFVVFGLQYANKYLQRKEI